MKFRFALTGIFLLMTLAGTSLSNAQVPNPTVTLAPAQGPSGTRLQVSACGFLYVVHPPYPDITILVDGQVKARVPGINGRCGSSVNLFAFGPNLPSPAQTITIEGAPGKHTVRVEARTPNTPVQFAEATFTITGNAQLAPALALVPQPVPAALQRAQGTIAQLRVRTPPLPPGSGDPFPDAQVEVQLAGNTMLFALYIRGDGAMAGNQALQALRDAFLLNIAVELWYQPVPNQPAGTIFEVVLKR
jgi:hypothetical protein